MLVVGTERHRGAGRHAALSSTPMCSVSRRAGEATPGDVTHQHGHLGVVELEARQLGMVLEGRGPSRVAAGWATQSWTACTSLGPGGVLLGVGHPVAGGHEVQLAGPDELLGAQAVEMQELAGQEPRHGLEAHVGMRARCRTPRPVRRRTGPA